MGDASTCVVSGFSTDEIGVLGLHNTNPDDATSDTLIVAVSQPSVPEPATLALLGSALAGFAFVQRRRRGPTAAK
jgi:hypothetical protein